MGSLLLSLAAFAQLHQMINGRNERTKKVKVSNKADDGCALSLHYHYNILYILLQASRTAAPPNSIGAMSFQSFRRSVVEEVLTYKDYDLQQLSKLAFTTLTVRQAMSRNRPRHGVHLILQELTEAPAMFPSHRRATR